MPYFLAKIHLKMDLTSPCFRSKKLMVFGSTDYLLYNYSSNDTTVIDAKIFLK